MVYIVRRGPGASSIWGIANVAMSQGRRVGLAEKSRPFRVAGGARCQLRRSA